MLTEVAATIIEPKPGVECVVHLEGDSMTTSTTITEIERQREERY